MLRPSHMSGHFTLSYSSGVYCIFPSLHIRKQRLGRFSAHRLRPRLCPLCLAIFTFPYRWGAVRGLTTWIISRFGHLVCRCQWS